MTNDESEGQMNWPQTEPQSVVASSAEIPAEIPADAPVEISTETSAESSTETSAVADEPASTFDFSVLIEDDRIDCRFECEGRVIEWSAPKTVVHRANKAVTVSHLFDLLFAGPILGCELRDGATNEPEFLMVRRAVNAIVDRVEKSIRIARKAREEAT